MQMIMELDTNQWNSSNIDDKCNLLPASRTKEQTRYARAITSRCKN